MPTYSGIFKDDTDAPVGGRVARLYRRDTGAFLGEVISSDGTPIPGDSFYPNTSLLLLCNGADGSTSIIDSSATPKTVTVSGDAKLTTTFSKYGGSSLALDGTGDWVTANDASFAVGTGDFTFDAWVYLQRTSDGYDYLFHLADSGGSQNTGIYARWTDGGFGNVLQCAISDTLRCSGPNRSAAANAWHHFEFSRGSGTNRLFWDGVLQSSSSNDTASGGTYLRVGAALNGLYPIMGCIGGFRFLPGQCRHTTNFTPPARAFPTSASDAPTTLGEIVLSTGYSGEVQLVYLDDGAGTIYNDKIRRALPA